ncbi:MAG: corrinoid protein [Candidatus Korobacteraceae bacterium]|jgi:corrinoid protein of di/trimethylamine methyltransferase
MSDQKLLHKDLSDAVVEMDEQKVITLSQKVVDQHLSAFEAIDQGLAHGMERAGKLFEDEEYFVPEILLCSDALYAGLDILRPHVEKKADAARIYKVVIGVVQGDTHDIGKNLVKLLTDASGFEIHDLGRDVAPQAFVDKAREVSADVIALSTLMTTTMAGMQSVVEILKTDGVRDQFKVVVGGGPVSKGFADRIGADGYAANAAEAVTLIKSLVGEAARAA